MNRNPGIGATNEFSLRMSIATLARVVFENSTDRELMLALERKAAYRADEQRVVVKAQPFGGAIRIHDLTTLLVVSGGFNFDSERSRTEQDFRIFIRPIAWQAVKDFCVEQFKSQNDAALETSPIRELEEELMDSLDIRLKSDQYVCKSLSTVIENNPTPTDNIHSAGQPTVRIYRVFEICIMDTALSQSIMLNSQSYSEAELQTRALDDLQKGGKGRANAILTLPLERLHKFYMSLSSEMYNSTVSFGKINLERNVGALLNDISIPNFQYVANPFINQVQIKPNK